MKHIKEFKLFETDEWSSDVNWNYVKNNPEDDSEESNWIKILADDLEYIQVQLENEEDIIFEINDIRGHDLYSGPYANVNINGKNYEIWTGDEYPLYIMDFPINNSEEDENDVFKGDKNEVIQAIIDSKPINMASKKYNL